MSKKNKQINWKKETQKNDPKRILKIKQQLESDFLACSVNADDKLCHSSYFYSLYDEHKEQLLANRNVKNPYNTVKNNNDANILKIIAKNSFNIRKKRLKKFNKRQLIDEMYFR